MTNITINLFIYPYHKSAISNTKATLNLFELPTVGKKKKKKGL